MSVCDAVEILTKLLRSLGYAGDSPTNLEGETVLKLLNDLEEALKTEITELLKPNRAYKAEVDLSTARTDASLISEWGLTGKAPFFSLTVLRVGDGTFTLKVYFTDTDYVTYTQDELADGYIIDRQFVDLVMTNDAQSATNPKFIIDWRE